MNTRERVSTWAFLAALVIMSVLLLLPQLRFVQKQSFEGPEVPYGNSDYTISGYYLPTIDFGTPISVTLSGYKPGTVILSLFPTGDFRIAPDGPPIISINRPLTAEASASVQAPTTHPYGIFVVSYNGTDYLLTVSSVWSPFYGLVIYDAPAVFVLIATGIAAYYFRQTAAVRRAEEKVWRELQSEAVRED